MQDQASLPSSAWSDGVFLRGGEDSVVAASKREVIAKDRCQAVHGPMVYFSEVVKTALWQQARERSLEKIPAKQCMV